jgi:hypothetical protein
MNEYSKNYSDLELMVMEDMMSLGYDPLNIEDIKLYWEFMLT